MREGIYDKALDKLNLSLRKLRESLVQDFKNTRGVRQPKVTPREQFYDYAMNWNPELEPQLRQNLEMKYSQYPGLGNLIVDNHKRQMEALREEFDGRT